MSRRVKLIRYKEEEERRKEKERESQRKKVCVCVCVFVRSLYEAVNLTRWPLAERKETEKKGEAKAMCSGLKGSLSF